MIPFFDDWTIVVVGSWNVGILNPDWLTQNILPDTPIEIEVLVDPGRVRVQYLAGDVRIIPSTSRLVIATLTANALPRAEQVACRILEALPVTPVVSAGINFGFVENAPDNGLLNVFAASDNDSLGDASYAITETSITRKLMRDDQLLNLRLTLSQTGAVRFHFNHHQDIAGADGARAALQGMADQKRQQSVELMRNLYGLEEEGVH